MPATLMRWDPLAELASVNSGFDRLVGEITGGRERGWIPAIDVLRDNGSLVLTADIPGIRPEEVKIEVEGGILTLAGEHTETKEEKDSAYVRRERRFGAFYRSVTLPVGTDASTITARTHEGVLEIRIPLPKEAKKETVLITPSGA